MYIIILIIGHAYLRFARVMQLGKWANNKIKPFLNGFVAQLEFWV